MEQLKIIIYNHIKINEYYDLSEIFQELGAEFSGEIELIEDIGEHESYCYEFIFYREEDNLNKLFWSEFLGQL